MALSNAAQAALLTLDPGFRKLGDVLDQVIAGCACTDAALAKRKDAAKATLAPPEVTAWVNELKKYSLDPALAFLATVLGERVAACCGAVPAYTDGSTAEDIAKRTLDPGARRLAQALDGFIATCC